MSIIKTDVVEKALKAEGQSIQASAPRNAEAGKSFTGIIPTGNVKVRVTASEPKYKFYGVEGTIKGRVYPVQVMEDDLKLMAGKDVTIDAVTIDVALKSGKTIQVLEMSGFTAKDVDNESAE